MSNMCLGWPDITFFQAISSITTTATAIFAVLAYYRGQHQRKLENSHKLIAYYWDYMKQIPKDGDKCLYDYLDDLRWNRNKADFSTLLDPNPSDKGALRQSCEILNLISKQCLAESSDWEFIAIEFKDIFNFSADILGTLQNSGRNVENFNYLLSFHSKRVRDYTHLGKRFFSKKLIPSAA